MRRLWWKWRLRVWKRRLVRRKNKAQFHLEHPRSGWLIDTYRGGKKFMRDTDKAHQTTLNKAVAYAQAKINLYSDLLDLVYEAKVPRMRLISGGKK